MTLLHEVMEVNTAPFRAQWLADMLEGLLCILCERSGAITPGKVIYDGLQGEVTERIGNIPIPEACLDTLSMQMAPDSLYNALPLTRALVKNRALCRE